MSVLKLAYRLLCEYEGSGRYVNLLLNSPAVSALPESDRQKLTALLYTAVEGKIRYDYYISALSKRGIGEISENVRNILRLGLCQICDIKSIPDYAAVNESVKLAQSPPERSFINGVLRAAVREKDKLPLPDKDKNYLRYLGVKYSFPLWMVKRLNKQYGDECEDILGAMNSRPPLTLLVNTKKIEREEYINELRRRGVSAEKTEYSPLGVRVFGVQGPKKLYGFSEGLIYVQDEASQLSALALGATAGDRIIDVCAAPGGKSIAAAISAGDGCEVLSFDSHEGKIRLIEESAARLSIKSVRAAARDARTPDKALYETADRLICDVPCSGLGVISKKPDLRYKDEESISALPELSLEILESSVSYLRPGGVAIFSTCTVLYEENEAVFSEFLSRHPEFSPLDFAFGELRSRGGMMTLLPNRHKTDGFFIAKMRKNK